MREATLEQFMSDAAKFVSESQQEQILITREGEPVAVLVGVEGRDPEDAQLEASPEFWQMIEERQKRPTIKLKDVKAHLLRDD
jgi:prevent-host-death family protein